MSIHGRRLSALTKGEILNLVKERTPEDTFLDFKRELGKDEGDLVADIVAFANAQGGLLIVGVEEDGHHRAYRLAPMPGDQAKRAAASLRDSVIAHVKPPITQLEVSEFQMDEDGNEWIVLARIPEGESKPYMSAYSHNTRFAVRTGDRKREMAYDEISRLFLASPQQEMMARFLGEIRSIKSLVEDLGTKLPK